MARLYLITRGKALKHYHAKDGAGIFRLHDASFEVGVISGWPDNVSQQAILKHLKIKRVSLGSNNKLEILNEWCKELDITLNEVAYIGDDVNDIEVMKKVKMVVCPNNAVEEVKEIANVICKKNGGEGSVREFCDFILNYNHRLNMDFSIAGLICVKYNSTRLPYKNFRKFGNTTLLDIKIQQLLKLDFLNSVVVNTESDYIIDYVSNKYDNPKLKIVKREYLYASNEIDNSDFCRNVVSSINEKHVCYSPVTMPFITEETYKKGYEILCDGKYDTIVLNADGKQGGGHSYEKHNICFGFSMISKEDAIKHGDFISNNPYYMICNERERMDIDYPDEFKMCLYHYFNKDARLGLENKHSLELNSLYNSGRNITNKYV